MVPSLKIRHTIDRKTFSFEEKCQFTDEQVIQLRFIRTGILRHVLMVLQQSVFVDYRSGGEYLLTLNNLRGTLNSSNT